MYFVLWLFDFFRHMSRSLGVSLVFLCALSCSAGHQKPSDDSMQAISPLELKKMPNIGDIFAPDGRQRNFELMTSPASFDPCFLCRYRDIDLMVAVNDSNKVIHISIDDEDFATPEGIRVGSILRDLLAIPGTQLSEVRGWAYIVVLPSGWAAAFYDNDTNNAVAPSADTPVKWLFMR